MCFDNLTVYPSDWHLWKGQGEREKESEQFPYMAFIPCEGVDSTSDGLTVTFDQSSPWISTVAPFAETVEGGVNIFANRLLTEEIYIPRIVCYK